jgi:hypothetical protein
LTCNKARVPEYKGEAKYKYF